MIQSIAEVHALQRAFARHLRDPAAAPLPPGIPESRAAVYRELLFNNISGAVHRAFPVAKSVLGDARWEALVSAFWRDHVSHTPQFARIPHEFLSWAQSRAHGSENEPGFLLELLAWELAELTALLAPDDPRVKPGDLFQEVPVVTRSLTVLAFAWPVQQISVGYQPREPLDHAQFLACYRRGKGSVAFLCLTPAAALLLEQLAASPNDTGRQHVATLSQRLGLPEAALCSEGQALLTTLSQQGVVIGTRPANTNTEDDDEHAYRNTDAGY